MLKQAEDVQDDLQRMDYGDPEIRASLEHTRKLHRQKGIPYRELCQSKALGTIKYLLKELNDEFGTVLITDLDTNNTYRFIDAEERKPKRNQIREWIERSSTLAA